MSQRRTVFQCFLCGSRTAYGDFVASGRYICPEHYPEDKSRLARSTAEPPKPERKPTNMELYRAMFPQAYLPKKERLEWLKRAQDSPE